MADQPIDPSRLAAWIADMRAQLNRIDEALRPPEKRSNATYRARYRRRRRKFASDDLRRLRYTMTQ